MKKIIQKYQNNEPLTEEEQTALLVAMMEAKGRAERRKQWEEAIRQLPPPDELEHNHESEHDKKQEPDSGLPQPEQPIASPSWYSTFSVRRGMLAIAATLFGIFISWQVWVTVIMPPLDRQIDQYLAEAFAIPQTRMGNGSITPDQKVWEEAKEKYNDKEYNATIQILQQLLANDAQNPQYLYYLGLSQLYSQHYDTAIVPFEQLILQNHPLYRYDVKWYAALTYIKLKQPEKARVLLTELAQTPISYQSKAQKLLQEIGNSDKTQKTP